MKFILTFPSLRNNWMGPICSSTLILIDNQKRLVFLQPTLLDHEFLCVSDDRMGDRGEREGTDTHGLSLPSDTHRPRYTVV